MQKLKDYTISDNTTELYQYLIHGDAASCRSRSLCTKLAQMSKLDGYSTGGTIHFVINNQVGFTTDFEDARSSHTYCTDVAKYY